MNINIDNCYGTLEEKMKEVEDVIEPLQDKNYELRVTLANVRLMYVTAINILNAYKELKQQ